MREQPHPRAGRARSRTRRLAGVTALAAGVVAPALAAHPAAAAETATTYHVVVTCKVPRLQPERQIAPNHCMNYLPDGTQTFDATVTDGSGRRVQGVRVSWSDNSTLAAFRVRKNPCTTGSNGSCGDELVVKRPSRCLVVTVTATVGSATAKGYLSFS